MASFVSYDNTMLQCCILYNMPGGVDKSALSLSLSGILYNMPGGVHKSALSLVSFTICLGVFINLLSLSGILYNMPGGVHKSALSLVSWQQDNKKEN